jgi:hypothetical protein
MQRLLGVAPIDLSQWLALAATAGTIVAAMELHKAWRRGRARA